MKIPSIRSVQEMNPIIVGLVTLAFLGAMVGGAMAVGTFGLLKHQYEVSGVFTDAAGLHKGADVRLAGVEVGQVTGISPDFDHGQVVITWKVNDGVHLGPNTRADVGTATLLGGDVIRLSNTSGARASNTCRRARGASRCRARRCPTPSPPRWATSPPTSARSTFPRSTSSSSR